MLCIKYKIGGMLNITWCRDSKLFKDQTRTQTCTDLLINSYHLYRRSASSRKQMVKLGVRSWS